jgi:hypothetical protein
MDPATAGLAALGGIILLLGEQAATHYAVWRTTRAGAEREQAALQRAHDAERALAERLLAEQHGHVDALVGELARREAEASRAARSGAEAAELRAALDRAAGAGPDGAADGELLRAARAAAAARRRPPAGAGQAAPPGAALVAGPGAGGPAPGPGGAPAG